MTLKDVSANKIFGGWNIQKSHTSEVLGCDMRFAVYLPPQASKDNKVPALYWLSGLTCTDENFMHKAGAQRMAAELGIAIIAPDTSPRGDDVPNDEAYDLGQGAGFYVNATQAPWNKHFHMYDYITQELPALIEANFPISDVKSISGHSMGGHGALTIAMRNPDMFKSVSAFAPISNPTNCPWGKKAFTAYLGDDQNTWAAHDTVELIKKAEKHIPAKVDQGAADNFLAEQLGIDTLIQTVKEQAYPMEINIHEGYDHSYFFMASFIEEHLKFHAKHLSV